MKKQTAVEEIQQKIEFEIKNIQMDMNNEVEYSMSVIKNRFEKLLKYSESIKEMEKQQIIDCSIETTQSCWHSLMEELGHELTFTEEDLQSQKNEAEEYYNETFKSE